MGSSLSITLEKCQESSSIMDSVNFILRCWLKILNRTVVVLALILELLFIHPLSAEKNNVENSNGECQLKYGWADWAPLQYVDAAGELTGVQVDLVNTVSNAVGCDLTFVKLSWAQILQGLQSGEIDFTANATESEFRRSFAYFSIPYRRDTLSFWVKEENRARFDYLTVEKVMKSGMTLGLIADQLYSPEIELWKKDPTYGKNISYTEEIDELILLLEQGKVESIVEDPYVIAFRRRIGGFTGNITHLSVQTFGYPVGFMFSKKSTSKKLVEKYNQKMRELKNTSALHSIWIDPEFIK